MGFNTFPCNPYPISTEELNKGNNDDLNTRVTALEGEVSDLNSTKANLITIAPFFSAEASYNVGDLVYYNGLTYRCTNDHEGEWDADDFAATTIVRELDSLKSGITNLNNLARFIGLTNTPTKISMNSSYFAAIISGYVAQVGGVNIAVTATPSGTTAINLMTGSAFSSTHLVIDNDGSDLVLTSDNSSGGFLMVISGNPA